MLRLSKKYGGLQFFAAPYSTFVFDSHIKSITDADADSITASGSMGQLSGLCTATLDEGYIIDSAVSTEAGTISNITNTTFNYSPTIGGTVTLTSKLATNRISVDLTMLSGWASLSSGAHNIQIVARAGGYRDSEKSEAVSVTKAGTPQRRMLADYEPGGPDKTTVAFTSNGNQYTAIEYSNSELKYYDSANNATVVYNSNGWLDFNYREVTFANTPPDSLLPWLVSNSVVMDDGYRYAQLTPTTNTTLLPNMNTNKIYSVCQLSRSGSVYYIGTFAYVNNAWTCTSANYTITSQTNDSITFYTGADHHVAFTSASVIEGPTALDKTSSMFGYDSAAAQQALMNHMMQSSCASVWECITEGTLITLANGTTKAIEDITYDDELLVWNFYEGKFDSAKPCWITKPQIAHEYNLCKFSNGSEIGFVGEGGDIGYHRIYNDEAKAFTHTGVAETPIGTRTFAEDGTFPELISQEIVTKPVRYYNIGTDKHINLFANGILTSSRISNKYAIEDMRYVGERLISEQEEKDYIKKKLELS